MPLIVFIFYSIDFKGIWVPRWSIPDNQKIFETIDDKFNHIFLQVFGNGEAYYPSEIVPTKMNDDRWLRELLHYAHLKGIKVSAWVNLLYSWGYAPRSNDPRHPINFAEDWYVFDREGRSILNYRTDELKKLNIEGYFMTPANPSVRIYLLKIIEEIISKYDFDGIHIDYVRYPHEDFVYDIYLRTKFQREYFYDPLDFFSETLKIRFGLTGLDDLTRKWREFVNDDLTGFIIQIRDKIKSIKSNCILSAAVKPDPFNSRIEFYQDWVTWVNNDYVDFVCLMAYTRNIDGIIKNTLESVNSPQKVAIGLGIYCLNPETIREQIEMIKKTPLRGFVYFSYAQLRDNPRYLELFH
ncbi:MAG: family 10 glycosylhydrolase [candidate division WOR-3 bacterium]